MFRSRNAGGGGSASGDGGSYVPPSIGLKINPLDPNPGKSAADAFATRADARLDHIKSSLFGIDEEEREKHRTEEEKAERTNFWITVAFAGFASVTMAFSLVSIHFASWGITNALCLALGTAPAIVVQRTKLNHMGSLREAINRIRQQVNRLHHQNDRLHEENNHLKIQVDKLQDIERALADVVTRQGCDVEKFVAAVRENAIIQAEMKKYLHAQVVQETVEVALTSDRNADFCFDDNELDMLVRRIQFSRPKLAKVDFYDLRDKIAGDSFIGSGESRRMSDIVHNLERVYEEYGVGELERVESTNRTNRTGSVMVGNVGGGGDKNGDLSSINSGGDSMKLV